MPTIFNPNNFGVFVHAIERELAPLESVAIDDAKAAEALVTSGVLKDNADELESAIKAKVEALGSGAVVDAGELEQLVRDEIANDIKRYHAEHPGSVSEGEDLDSDASLKRNATAAALQGEELQPIPSEHVAHSVVLSEETKTEDHAEVLAGPAQTVQSDGQQEVVQGDQTLAQVPAEPAPADGVVS
jgi:hypothetical protein